MVRILSKLATAATFFACALAADLQILAPNGNTWWVARSNNVLAWNCNEAPSPATFTILIANKDVNVLTAPIAIIGIEDNFQCSQLITQDQSNQPAALGYTILFADTLNNTKIYATSEEFEIKALGSAYPTTTSGVSATSTGNSTSSASSPTASGSGAQELVGPFGALIAAVGAVLGLIA